MSEQHTVSVEVLGDGVELTLVELCRASRTAEEQVRVWIVEGVLAPTGSGPADWRFGGAAVHRARLARALSQDLEVNVPGVALALDLIDEIEDLKARLRRAGLR